MDPYMKCSDREAHFAHSWPTQDMAWYWCDGLLHGRDFIPPPQREKLLWAAVDFDQTLCESNWTPDNPDAAPGKPLPNVRAKMHELRSHGYKPVVHTARGWADYEIIEAWLEHHDIPFSRIVCGKLLAKVYIDDRNGPAFDADSWLPGGYSGTQERQVSARATPSYEAPAEQRDDASRGDQPTGWDWPRL